jgi:predicted Zn-dependent protease
MMRHIITKINTHCNAVVVLVVMSLLSIPKGHCITIQEEREMSKEFIKVVQTQFPLIRDPIIVDYVNRVGNRILNAIEPQPFDYQFYVLHEDVYNAFATPAGHIFFNSGLFAALDSEEELAGILGHEIAHVTCRHISDRIESSKRINVATMAGMVAGVLLGASGAGEAASALTMGSLAAGQSAVLAYSRENETQADQLGLEYLARAGYSGEGLLTSLKKIRSKQWYGSNEVPTYLTTHPASEARMGYIDNWLNQHPDHKEMRRTEVGGFELAHTRLVALYTDKKIALDQFRAQIDRTPGDPFAHYGYALTLTRSDKWHEAIHHMKVAIEGNALATHMLIDLGTMYFHDGQYENAEKALLAGKSEKDPQGLLYLGRTQMELGQVSEAKQTFENLVSENESYALAYYYLGESSGMAGDMFNAHYNLGRYYQQKRDVKNAEFHLNRALKIAADENQKELASHQLRTLHSQRRGKKAPGAG